MQMRRWLQNLVTGKPACVMNGEIKGRNVFAAWTFQINWTARVLWIILLFLQVPTIAPNLPGLKGRI